MRMKVFCKFHVVVVVVGGGGGGGGDGGVVVLINFLLYLTPLKARGIQ
jgi:hypothetical protein